MASQALEFHVSGRKLLTAMLVTIVPISLVALYASTRVGGVTEEKAGDRLRTVAESVAGLVQERIRGKVIEAALIAADADVLKAVAESNRQYERVRDEEILKRMQERDKIWNTPQGEDLVKKMLSSPASAAVRRKLQIDPSFLRITVTDRRGATVAASHKTLDYYQGDEEYWKDIFVTGRGAVSLTDILYDDASKHYYIGVGVPVVDENNELIGTSDALVDVSALFPLVHRSDVGAEGRAALVKADGSIIVSSDGLSLADRASSPEFAAVQDAQSQFQGRASGHLRAKFPNGEDLLVAFADTGLKNEYRRLDWSVVVAEPASEALAGASLAQVLIMGIALLSLASVVFLAVYFALHRRSEIEEIEAEMSQAASGTAE